MPRASEKDKDVLDYICEELEVARKTEEDLPDFLAEFATLDNFVPMVAGYMEIREATAFRCFMRLAVNGYIALKWIEGGEGTVTLDITAKGYREVSRLPAGKDTVEEWVKDVRGGKHSKRTVPADTQAG